MDSCDAPPARHVSMLPRDVLQLILSELTPPEWRLAQTVCKQWYQFGRDIHVRTAVMLNGPADWREAVLIARSIQRAPSSLDELVADDSREAVIACRKLLAREKNPPIRVMVRAGVVPYLVSFLGRKREPELQFEAAWAVR